MRELGKLSVAKVDKLLRRARPGKHGDGRGLWLQISQWGTGAWLLRYTVDGRERWMGLGSVQDVPLALARQRAREHRNRLWDGTDPIEERKTMRAKRRAELARRLTFEEAGAQYVAAHQPKWRSPAHAQQWRQSMKAYAYPLIGKVSVGDIDTGLVVKTLDPIWTAKPETARRVRSRIAMVLDWAAARGLRPAGDNPARWAGHLEHILPETNGGKKHFAAMPYKNVPVFMAELRGRATIGARALEFQILCASRTGEVLNAKWDEFLEDIWTVPASRMKSGVEHRIPLSERCMEILRELPREEGSPWVFVGARAGRPLSNMSLVQIMRRTPGGYVPHGFRASFRTWAAEQTAFPHEVLEQALAHKVSDAVVRSYQRGDFFDKRRRLMVDWARFCASPVVEREIVHGEPADNVVGIRG